MDWKRLRDRLDALQRRMGVKVILSVLAFFAVAGGMYPMLSRISTLASQRSSLIAALRDKDVDNKDEAAISLQQNGTVTVDGRTWGGEHIKQYSEAIFEDGRIIAPEQTADLLMEDARREVSWMPQFLIDNPGMAWFVGAGTLAWLLLSIWLDLTLALVLTVAATALPALPAILLGSAGWTLAVLAMGLLGFSFMLLVRAALLALGGKWQACAVAHTLIKESMRLRISQTFIILLLVVLPLIPLWISPDQPLRYQVQTFIARSMDFTFLIAGCMTLLFGAATVSFEIRDRQIWQLMTKPVSRLSYLLGKWVGIATINAILLIVTGISIFIFIQYLRTRPAADDFDSLAVHEEVLTARAGSYAEYSRLTRDELLARSRAKLANDQTLKSMVDSGARDEIDVLQELAKDIQIEYLRQQRWMDPGEARTFVFKGLESARRLNAPLTLRYQLHGGASDTHEVHYVTFQIADRAITRAFVPTQVHVLTLPPSIVRDDGTTEITVIDGVPDGRGGVMPSDIGINWDADKFELLYKVGDFEGNFLRAVMSLWVKLAFLGMLAICAATFLSFPVACVLSFTIFAIGSMAPFLADSLEYYELTSAWRVDQYVITWIATAAEWLLRAFGTVRPTQSLVEGRFIPLRDVLNAFVVIGVCWSGVTLVIGFLAFRRKELAIYSGAG